MDGSGSEVGSVVSDENGSGMRSRLPPPKFEFLMLIGSYQ